MAAYGYAEPAIFISERDVSPQVQAYFATSGHTGTNVINRADLVTLAGAGTLGRAASGSSFTGGSALVSGFAIHSETAVWTSSTTGSGAPPGGGGIGNLFGATSVSTAAATALLPGEPGSVHVNKLLNNQWMEFTLDTAVAWATSLINSSVYLSLDATSNLYYVTTTQPGSAVVFGTLQNVIIHGTQGFIGDTGVRVLVTVSTSVAN